MENDSAWTQEDATLLEAMEAQMETLWVAFDEARVDHGDERCRGQAMSRLSAQMAKIRVYQSYIEELRAKRERSQDAGISGVTSGLVFISSLVVFGCFRIYRASSS